MIGRAFAIVPAAGRSVRMGRPKLLIDLAGQPLVWRVIDAWKAGGVERIVVVMRRNDGALAEVVRAAGAEIVQPQVDPPDMKASIGHGVDYIARTMAPQAADVWLVAPADMPGLSPDVIRTLIAEADVHPGRILIPTLAGKQGHPVLLPWLLAAEVARLGESEGLDALIARHDPLLVPCDGAVDQAGSPFADLDTPEDVERFQGGGQES